MALKRSRDIGVVPDSFEPFTEGDIEPCSKKRIHTLIHAEKECIVYLDEDLIIQWYVNDQYGNRFADGFSDIKNRAAHLESLSEANKDALTPGQLVAFRRMLAESFATALDVDQKDSDAAQRNLDKAEEYFRARSSERARAWYLTASFSLAALLALAFLFLWLFRSSLQLILGRTAFESCLGAALGGVGAFVWILYRFHKIETDVTAGRWVHYLEGSLRTLAGSAGGAVMLLAVKANVLLGFLNTQENLPLLALICVAAGASERIVPSLIKKVEILGGG